MEEDIEELKRLFYANALTQYGKRKLIGRYEQQIKELEENSIPVSLVKENLEELEKQYKFYNSDKRETKNIAKGYYIAIQKLKELLEGK